MDYYKHIKQELINNEINKKVKNYSINRIDLTAYYNVGKLLLEAGTKYGEGIIKEYSKRLSDELGSGYSQRNLRNMRQFYRVSKNWQTMSAKLSWSHYCEILWFEDNKFLYYVKMIEANNLSIRQLRERIKSKEYERLSKKTKEKLIYNKSIELKDLIPNPILIKNSNYGKVSEKILQRLILEDIEAFMNELGNNYSFIGSEYKIKIENNYNYIDLLLFNIEYNCYVVVELKTTELKKEHIGQIQVYMNYIDINIKNINHDKTIGIIICRENNQYVIKYCSDSRIISRTYKFI
ncbi:MAG: DUF1016 family protein [Bacilli bacterium]|nr:DUF1016 family protein [Bacilli bacterium]